MAIIDLSGRGRWQALALPADMSSIYSGKAHEHERTMDRDRWHGHSRAETRVRGRGRLTSSLHFLALLYADICMSLVKLKRSLSGDVIDRGKF